MTTADDPRMTVVPRADNRTDDDPPRPMRRLHTNELETIVRWFLDHMDGDTRRMFMGDLPTLYMMLHPDASEAVVMANVRGRIDQLSAQSNLTPRVRRNI